MENERKKNGKINKLGIILPFRLALARIFAFLCAGAFTNVVS